jgi:hypothetical protein
MVKWSNSQMVELILFLLVFTVFRQFDHLTIRLFDHLTIRLFDHLTIRLFDILTRIIYGWTTELLERLTALQTHGIILSLSSSNRYHLHDIIALTGSMSWNNPLRPSSPHFVTLVRQSERGVCFTPRLIEKSNGITYKIHVACAGNLMAWCVDSVGGRR